MRIAIEGNSQDINTIELANKIMDFHIGNDICIDVDGLKFEGSINTIVYEETGKNRMCRIIKIVVETL